MSSQPTQSLEQRIELIEDQLAIYQVIAAYGPAADSCDLDANDELWTEDCVYKVDGIADKYGHAGLRELLEADFHRNVVAQGCAHVASLPFVVIRGADAYATNYHRLITNVDGKIEIVRLTASRWHLQKLDGKWQIKERINVMLNGKKEARNLLSQALQD